MKYSIDEETVFITVVAKNGGRYKGKFHLVEFGSVVLVTNGEIVLPLTSVRHLEKELTYELGNCREPRIYEPNSDSEDS